MIWTTKMIDRMKEMDRHGFNCRAIANELGVTRNAVIGQRYRLGMSRPRPVREPRSEKRNNKSDNLKRLLRTWGGDMANSDVDKGVTLMELQPHHCRWIIGRKNDRAVFCGCEKLALLPYCSGHAPRAYKCTAEPVIRQRVTA